MTTAAEQLSFLRYNDIPSDDLFKAFSFNPAKMANNTSPAAAGGFNCSMVRIPYPITISTMSVYVGSQASGSAGSNTYYGIFTPSGTRLGVTATDQASSWTTKGNRVGALTADAAGSLTLSQGWVWAAFIVGAAAGTPAALGCRGFGASASANLNLLNSSNNQSSTAPLRSFKIAALSTTGMPTSVASYITTGGLSAVPNFFIGLA
jgi:hypothetical protein